MKVLELLKRSRSLRLMMCAFMVPIVMLVQTGTAQAVAVDGLWSSTRTQVEFGSVKGFTAYGTVRCDVQVSRAESNGKDIQVRGSCSGHADQSPGYAQPGEPGAPVQFTFVGPGCAGVSGTILLGDSANNELWRVAGKIEHQTFGAVECVPTQVCTGHTDSLRSTAVRTDCGGISIPDPKDPTVCVDGEFGTPEIGERYARIDHGLGWYSKSFRGVVFEHDITRRAGRDWWAYVVTRTLDGDYDVSEGPIMDRMVTPNVRMPGWTSGADDTQTSTTIEVPFTADFDHDLVDDADDVREIVGAGIYQESPPGHSEWKTPGGPSPTGFERVGVNDAGVCSFYWGEQLWDDGEAGGPDEPAGDMAGGTPPHVEPPSDEVETPDESNWWRALYALLNRLIDAVVGLPGKIVDGLVAGLRTLFIPDSFPDWSGVGVDLPSGWVPELPSLSAGACGPLVIPEMNFGMAGDVGGDPLVDTCQAPWTTVRTVTYYGLLGLALVTVANRIFRAAMGGVGMSVESGGGGDDL